MEKKAINRMSYEELKLYEEQLNRELTAVRFYKRAKRPKGAKSTKTKSSQK